MNPIAISIAGQSIAHELQPLPPETPLEGLAKAAFEATKNDSHVWMCSNDDEIFRCGVAGLLYALVERGNEEGKQQVDQEMRTLRAVTAAMSGIPVDFSALSSDQEPIGLLKLFKDTRND